MDDVKDSSAGLVRLMVLTLTCVKKKHWSIYGSMEQA